MKSIIKSAAAAAAAIAGILAASSCNSGNQISGTLTGVQSDSIRLFVNDAVSNRLVKTDTVAIVDGKFKVNFPDTAMYIVYIADLHQTGNDMSDPIFMLPGDKLKVSGSLSEPVFSGTRIYDGLSRFEGHRIISEKLDSLYEKAQSVAKDDIVGRQAINAEHEKLSAQRDSIYAEYVKNNPDDITSGYLTIFMNPEKGLESYNLLGSTVKESAMGEFLDMIAGQFTTWLEKEKNKANIQPGKAAPDFSLKDIDGNIRTLASFKGKYALLDFWGKWCYWCMKGMPDMKKYYDKYSGRIEFVGINCGDTEEVWKETVEKEGLKWTNLYNGDSDEITTKYAIEGFPTKVLIDKEGMIVVVFVGECEVLYRKLVELF